MTGGFYTHTTAGWCGNCGRRRGPDGRCANCDPWWTSPLFQVGAPVVLLVSLVLIVGVSLVKQRAREEARIPATAVNTSIPATRIPAYGAVPGYGYPAPRVGRLSAPVVTVPATLPAYTPPVPPQQAEFQRLQELRRLTAYVDNVVQAERNARIQQARSQSDYYLPAASLTRRPEGGGRALQATF